MASTMQPSRWSRATSWRCGPATLCQRVTHAQHLCHAGAAHACDASNRLCMHAQVVVRNNLPANWPAVSEGISIHWHGWSMAGAEWYDGVGYLAMCPITPGTNFTYRFQVRCHHHHGSLCTLSSSAQRCRQAPLVPAPPGLGTPGRVAAVSKTCAGHACSLERSRCTFRGCSRVLRVSGFTETLNPMSPKP